MLCSEAELGIGEDAGTILLLDATAAPGADLVAHLGLDDVVLEVEITPNRPDCLSLPGHRARGRGAHPRPAACRRPPRWPSSTRRPTRSPR